MRRGLTVGRLLAFTAAAAVGVAVFIPHYQRLLTHASLRSTMIDMVCWAEAIERYATDHGSVPANPNGKIDYKKTLVAQVLPYSRTIRIRDWWGYPYWIWTGTHNRPRGLAMDGPQDYVIISLGSDGFSDGWESGRTEEAAAGAGFESSAQGKADIILMNRKFLRPSGAALDEGKN